MKSAALFLGILVGAVALATAQGYIGRVDTIGGTTYDWFSNGPTLRWCVNAPEHGIHVGWMYSTASSGTTFDDRDMRYNYYDYATRRWNWIDPDHMQGGVNVFTHRAGYGNIDADPASGVAITACHYAGTGGVTPKVAKDVAPGAGIFDYADGEPVLGYTQWPALAVGQDGTIHLAVMSPGGSLYYGRIPQGDWPNFDFLQGPFEPSPGFPSHAIAASLVNQRVCLTWAVADSHPTIPGYYALSSDGGNTWAEPVELTPPDGFGGDTATSFHHTSLLPFFDRLGRLHFIVAVFPVIHDTATFYISEIWHWCETNTPNWNEVHRAELLPTRPVKLAGLYAGRPTMTEDTRGRLHVVWEQHDSMNVEPLTDYVRCRVWVSSSADNGVTWLPGKPVTPRDTTSCRYPCAISFVSQDTLNMTYLQDLVAGPFVLSEGPATDNPVICQFVPLELVGVEESRQQAPSHKLQATVLRALPAGVVVFDAMGRRVLNPKSGVYFVVSEPPVVSREPSAVTIRKVVIQR